MEGGLLTLYKEVVTKIISKKKQCKEAKWLLRRAYKQLGREAKGKGGPGPCHSLKTSPFLTSAS